MEELEGEAGSPAGLTERSDEEKFRPTTNCVFPN